MKKSKRRLTFATVIAGTALATTLTACHWKGQDPVETVYGPPAGTTYEPAEEEPQDVYGPPIDNSYNEKEEIPEIVYGPPGGRIAARADQGNNGTEQAWGAPRD